MRVQSHVTSVSWIPSEAVTGPLRGGFGTGARDHDEPPPALVDDLKALRAANGFRFANRLSAWAEFVDGRPVAHGVEGGGVAGSSTTARIGSLGVRFAAVPMPDLRGEPEIGDGWVRFTQTSGGRTALPLPRRTSTPPFVRLSAPLMWTTLSLTLYADGRAEYTLDGASAFPRHWVYGPDDLLAVKAGVTDWQAWTEGRPRTPWGDEDSPVLVAAAESALERRLSTVILGGERPPVRRLGEDEVLVRQGDPGDSLFLVLDGVLSVDVDGRRLAEVGPGAVVGERAMLEGGIRTATVAAVTPVRVAEVSATAVDRSALERLAGGRRRELETV